MIKTKITVMTQIQIFYGQSEMKWDEVDFPLDISDNTL
jgi:hypothetical protein